MHIISDIFTTIFSAFASFGTFCLCAVFVVASMVAVPYMFAVLGEALTTYVFPSYATDKVVNRTIFCGVMTGLVWSIWATISIGLVSAFLSVLALCGALFIIAAIVWFFGETSRPVYNGD